MIMMNNNIVWQTPANPPETNDYIFRNGRRHVRPYYFEFISHVKSRWAGKTIVDLFTEEFRGRSYDYYVSAVKSGRIQVNGQRASISYRVQSSEKISHFLHRYVLMWSSLRRPLSFLGTFHANPNTRVLRQLVSEHKRSQD